MRAQYTDDKLAALLAWTEDGGLTVGTCCCFIGILTADHPLRREDDYPGYTTDVPHYQRAIEIPGAGLAEMAFFNLARTDEERRAKLLPLIRAEMERRSLERSDSPVHETVLV